MKSPRSDLREEHDRCKRKINGFKELNSPKTRISKENDCLIFMLAIERIECYFHRKNFFLVIKNNVIENHV